MNINIISIYHFIVYRLYLIYLNNKYIEKNIKLKNKIIIYSKNFFSYTCYSQYLILYISIMNLFNINYSYYLLSISWNLNFLSIICYYIYLIKYNFNNKLDSSLFKNRFLVKYYSHGPILIFSYFYIKDFIKNNNLIEIFNIYSIFYSYLFSFYWFLFLYIPFYTFSNDHIYFILSPEINIFIRIKLIFKISSIFFISNFLPYLIFNKNE